ncbi:KTSC domain-containing protein [Aerosakkonemataceae cyanobacterium BLCC-F154]|uniref:KTSC domain-containing protein n=1 Tax=Floridaenema fluviatile BLCC-F154 TaxID=3153640 RepID=A0ABV4YBI8_9CYAN
MKLINIDLKNVVAVGYEDEHLGLLIDRGNQMEYLEVTAPVDAYEGMQKLAEIANEEAEIPMLPVTSTMASAMGYDKQRKVLQIEFSSGSVYQYDDVEKETWERFLNSDSKGKFYNKEIKGHYPSHCLDDGTVMETYTVVYAKNPVVKAENYQPVSQLKTA